MRTNINSHHNINNNNNNNVIESEDENLNNESVQNKDNDLHLAKSMNMNGSVSRKASDSNYDKYRYGHDVSLIPTYDYRKSFDADNRIGNNNQERKKHLDRNVEKYKTK